MAYYCYCNPETAIPTKVCPDCLAAGRDATNTGSDADISAEIECENRFEIDTGRWEPDPE